MQKKIGRFNIENGNIGKGSTCKVKLAIDSLNG